MRTRRRRWPAWLGLCLVAVLLTACSARPDNPGGVIVQREQDPNGFAGGASLSQPYHLPATVLTDTSGQHFNLQTSPSTKATLVFFGYTNCPDVCITVLANVAQALNRVDPATRQQIQMIFITTDPARDTGPVMRAYLDRFDPAFLGLTGDLDTIVHTAERLGVDVSGMEKLPSGGYEVGHTAQVIGFRAAPDQTGSRDGIVVWTPSTSVGDLKHDFTRLVELS